MDEIYDRWQRGELTDIEALRQLALIMQELETEGAPILERAKWFNDRIEEAKKFAKPIFEHLGTKSTVAAGYKFTSVEAGKMKVEYNEVIITTLLADLAAMGSTPVSAAWVAQRIGEARVAKSGRAGYVTVQKEKEKGK